MIEIFKDGKRVIPAIRRDRLQQAKKLVKQFAKPSGSVVDELILERQKESDHF